ncbi:hypothetical protein B484DRAFT_105207 [Ochromonadaceae sp. CCMP2298]|nr:hypothetical protein B484DRAFT_105207 [Ochromonadaceae sp. CCMP2298]
MGPLARTKKGTEKGTGKGHRRGLSLRLLVSAALVCSIVGRVSAISGTWTEAGAGAEAGTAVWAETAESWAGAGAGTGAGAIYVGYAEAEEDGQGNPPDFMPSRKLLMRVGVFAAVMLTFAALLLWLCCVGTLRWCAPRAGRCSLCLSVSLSLCLSVSLSLCLSDPVSLCPCFHCPTDPLSLLNSHSLTL